MSRNDPRLVRAYQSQDARNYTLQVAAAELNQAYVGLTNSFGNDLSRRFYVVVSHGNFDINKYAISRPPGGGGTPEDLGHANVMYVILDAVTGQYSGEMLDVPGCTRE
jgi:hypothetical protein